jgi:hypothetical protein
VPFGLQFTQSFGVWRERDGRRVSGWAARSPEKKLCKQPLSEISAAPTPSIGLSNPSPTDGYGDVVLRVLGEDGPHLKMPA